MIAQGIVVRYAVTLFVVLAASYVLVAVAAYVFQGRLVWFPDRRLAATPSELGLLFEDVTFQSLDGVRLHGWFVPALHPRLIVLFCHGNAGNISHRLDSIRIFHELGLSVFIFDYRGYGRSDGRPTEDGTYADARAAYAHLVRNRGMAPEQIVIFGRSLGAAVAIDLAATESPAALIAESAFPSIGDVGQRAYPFLPVKWFTRIRYDVLARVGGIRCPKLFVHSLNDDVVPFELGRRVYDVATEPKQWVEIRGDHNSGFLSSEPVYTQALRAFFDTIR